MTKLPLLLGKMILVKQVALPIIRSLAKFKGWGKLVILLPFIIPVKREGKGSLSIMHNLKVE